MSKKKKHVAVIRRAAERLIIINHELGYPYNEVLEDNEHPLGDIRARKVIAAKVREGVIGICKNNEGWIFVDDMRECSHDFDENGNETDIDFEAYFIKAAFKTEEEALQAELQIQEVWGIYGVYVINPDADPKRQASFFVPDLRSPLFEEVKAAVEQACGEKEGRLLHTEYDTVQNGRVHYVYEFPTRKAAKQAKALLANRWEEKELDVY